jgi:hypothetical protein
MFGSYIFKNKFQHIPPEEAGAKAAEAPIREARIASFIISDLVRHVER